ITSGVRLSHQLGGSIFRICGAWLGAFCAGQGKIKNKLAKRTGPASQRDRIQFIWIPPVARISIFRRRSERGNLVAECWWAARKSKSAARPRLRRGKNLHARPTTGRSAERDCEAV